MSQNLNPSPIVTHLLTLAETLDAWAVAHRTSTLAEHEQGVLRAVRQVLGPLLGAVLTRALQLDQPSESQRHCPCPQCGRRRAPHQQRPRQPVTVCGVVPFQRPYYYCAACHYGWAPADGVLDLAPHQVLSAGLQTWLATEGGDAAFAAAAQRIERLTGIGLGAETIRTHTEAVGSVLVAQQAAAAQQVLATQEPAEPVDPAPDVLLVEVDGAMLHYVDDWHEMKRGLLAGCRRGNGLDPDDPAYQPPELRAPSYVAARLEARAFGPLVLAEAARRGALAIIGWEQPVGTDPRLQGVRGPALAQLRPLVILADGAPWIWGLAAEHFGAARTEIVEVYHAVQHLWTLGRAAWGPDHPHGAVWVRRAERVLKERGATGLLPHLQRLSRRTDLVDTVGVQRERNYFRTNRERMAYPQYRAQGLPIGSGAIESAVHHVVQHRLKQPGMRWGESGAQAVAAVSARLASHRPLPTARAA